ncbi:MAG TPA: BrnA antitoxin family protein [Pseudacidobacterium sp.]|nr:BrnA antitoxin family protein [Pseudacidobacterium sp.]
MAQAIYLPILKFCLRHRWLTIAVNVIFLLVTISLATRLGSQFMPPLFEGSALYMPIALFPEVLEHFKSTGPGWQTRINQTLKSAIRKKKTGLFSQSAFPSSNPTQTAHLCRSSGPSRGRGVHRPQCL